MGYSASFIKGSLGKKFGVYRRFFGLLYSPCPSYSVDMISVCFQIFVPNVNRSQIDEMYNKTSIAKLEKLCSEVRTLMSSLLSISQAATKPVTEGALFFFRVVFPSGQFQIQMNLLNDMTRNLSILSDCKTVLIFAYSSTREQSNKRSGARLKTESNPYGRVMLARLARVRLLS